MTQGLAFGGPQAYLSVGKSRRKVFQDTYYLKDKTEFELELFNGSTKTVGAKIKLNGVEVSKSLLVLRPGQRIYLERFIDQPVKFRFDQYEVEADSPEVQKAIQENGKVEVQFFDEQLFTSGSGVYWIVDDRSFDRTPLNQPWNQFYTTCNGDATYTMGTGGAVNADNVSCNYVNADNVSCNASHYSGEVKVRGLKAEVTELKSMTGRIEGGSSSDQRFDSVDMRFSSFPTSTVSFRILPEEFIEEVRSYCTKCGLRRRKDNWSFCPKCGQQF